VCGVACVGCARLEHAVHDTIGANDDDLLWEVQQLVAPRSARVEHTVHDSIGANDDDLLWDVQHLVAPRSAPPEASRMENAKVQSKTPASVPMPILAATVMREGQENVLSAPQDHDRVRSQTHPCCGSPATRRLRLMPDHGRGAALRQLGGAGYRPPPARGVCARVCICATERQRK
jgi:hypothetical protein